MPLSTEDIRSIEQARREARSKAVSVWEQHLKQGEIVDETITIQNDGSLEAPIPEADKRIPVIYILDWANNKETLLKEFKQIQEEHPEININVSVAPDLTSVNYSVTQNNL